MTKTTTRAPDIETEMDIHERTRLLVGQDGLDRLRRARVAVLGLGGVGSAAAEALCRAGVGRLMIVDFDKVAPGNLNRQLLALRSTVGRLKAEVLALRLADIDPGCELEVRAAFFAEDTAAEFDLGRFDYVCDCIDSLNPKTSLIAACAAAGVRVVTSAGAGGRTDPTGVAVGDLFAVRGCPLARHLRKRLRGRGLHGPVPAVHSAVPAMRVKGAEPEEGGYRRGRPRTPVGSISYLPPLFGAVMAGYVVRSLLGEPLPSSLPAKEPSP
jgi:tRNA A37 threonylcarbamoyladenosine dehydratase